MIFGACLAPKVGRGHFRPDAEQTTALMNRWASSGPLDINRAGNLSELSAAPTRTRAAVQVRSWQWGVAGRKWASSSVFVLASFDLHSSFVFARLGWGQLQSSLANSEAHSAKADRQRRQRAGGRRNDGHVASWRADESRGAKLFPGA